MSGRNRGTGGLRLAIIDQSVSAGGVERFLHGLVGGMLEVEGSGDWDTMVLHARRNSAGKRMTWPEVLTSPNIHAGYMLDDTLRSRFIEAVASPRRIARLPGTVKPQRLARDYLVRHGACRHEDYAGYVRAWIERYCERERPDVAYFSYPYFMDCPRLDAAVVCTPHDFNYRSVESLDTFGLEAREVMDRQMKGWMSGSRAVVVSSDFIAGEVARYYPESDGKVRVVRLGTPLSRGSVSAGERERRLRRLGLPEDFLLVVGWLITHKNQKAVFEALGMLLESGRRVPLVCAGPRTDELKPANESRAGVYAREILDLARRLGLEYGTDYFGLGFVSDRDLECLYEGASALVVPSLYEAGSFPAREAMARRCPVVYARVPPLLEEYKLIERNAWTFEPGDTRGLVAVIEEITGDPGAASERAGRAAGLVGEIFSWKRTAEGYLSVFAGAASGGGD